MKKREMNINRGPFCGPLQTTTGVTYLRPQDITGVTQGSGVTQIHMTSGTIFTVKDTLTKTIDKLGIQIQIGFVASSTVEADDPMVDAETEEEEKEEGMTFGRRFG